MNLWVLTRWQDLPVCCRVQDGRVWSPGTPERVCSWQRSVHDFQSCPPPEASTDRTWHVRAPRPWRRTGQLTPFNLIITWSCYWLEVPSKARKTLCQSCMLLPATSMPITVLINTPPHAHSQWTPLKLVGITNQTINKSDIMHEVFAWLN